MLAPETDIHERRFWGRLGDNSNVSVHFKNRDQEILRKTGAGDEARTRNFQLGKLNV